MAGAPSRLRAHHGQPAAPRRRCRNLAHPHAGTLHTHMPEPAPAKHSAPAGNPQADAPKCRYAGMNVARTGPTEHSAAPIHTRGPIWRFLAPAALAALVAAVVIIVSNPPRTVGTHPKRAQPGHERTRKLPPYWTVHPGDTLTIISHRTGLTVDQLETFNPSIDPQRLLPGERLKLSAHPPKPRPKPPGPRFWIVRPGQSLGSIAAATGVNLAKLEQLNPRLKPATLQPGDRVRLRT
jgi:LysM repeat protein